MDNGDYFGEVVFTGGHEQTIVAVVNGDVDAGVTWADGQGEWEDGYNSGALRKAVDSGIVDMNDIVEIWRSKPIPEGPIVLRTRAARRRQDQDGRPGRAACTPRTRTAPTAWRPARPPASRRSRMTPTRP